MIIGIAGKAGVGKDTFGSMLLKNLDGFERLAFAQPIKRALVAAGVPSTKMYSPELKNVVMTAFGKSPREMMQTLGTDWGRNMINQDIWVMGLDGYRREHGLNHVVITDVRFPNEANYVRSEGVLVHVAGGGDFSGDKHESEGQSLGDVGDYVVDNGGDLDYLRKQAENMSELIKAEYKL